MKIDSESPTGERYEFISAAVDYVIENENATGDSYFITNTYERVRTLADLATDNKNSFIDAINELENSKVGSNDRVTGEDNNYSVTELLKWVAEGLEKSNSVNYPGLDYIIKDVYDMYNAFCSCGFSEPSEVIQAVADLKKQAENK